MGPPSGADVGAGVWTPRASIAGGGRLEAAVVALDDRLLLLGGFDRELDIVSRVDAYDPDTDSWSALAPMPVALTHLNAASVDGALYVLGGLSGVDFEGAAGAFRYDPASDAWTELTPLPEGRGASGVAVDGARIVVAGGSAGELVLDGVLAYDVTTDTWSELPALPSPRSHLAAAAFAGAVVVAGGLSGTTPLDETLALVDGTWLPRAPMPTARGGCAHGTIGGLLVCAGGETEVSVVRETEAYDPTTDAWTVLAPMLTPRAGTSGAVLSDQLHVPGGARVLLYQPSAIHESFSLTAP